MSDERETDTEDQRWERWLLERARCATATLVPGDPEWNTAVVRAAADKVAGLRYDDGR